MQFYITDNVVYKNKDVLGNVDFEIINPNLEEKNIYIGENGVGKTFHLHVVSSLAYLASDYDIIPVQDYDRQRVIQDLADARIGDMRTNHQPDEECLIQHRTSYYGDEEKENESVPEGLSDIDDVRKALEIGAKMKQALDRHYCVKIGPEAKSFFDTNNVIYYSNSQFPSNVTFFSKSASSFQADDVDVGFWMLYRNLKEKSHLKIRIWLNNSLGSKDCSEIMNVFKTQGWHDKIKYKYRKIFNFYEGGVFSSLATTGNRFFDWVVNWIENNRSKFSPSYEFPFEKDDGNGVKRHFPVDSYLIILMLKEYFDTFNYEVYYDDVPLSKLNSGKRYLLALDCLENIYNNGKNTVLIIDEPENSLHLSIQEKIAESKVYTLVATHSPAFAMSIMSRYPNKFKLHVLKKDSGGVLEEEIVEDNYLDNNSLDSMAAEFFFYSPFLERWNELNGHINKSNLIDVNEFYRDLEKLK